MGTAVIMLNGPPKIGKGWLAGHICSQISEYCQVRIMSFAQPIRDWAQSRYRFLDSEYMEWKDSIIESESGKSGRELMIDYGTARRAEEPEYFVRLMLENPLFRNMVNGIVIIDDLGFTNENEHMHANCQAATIVMSPTQYSPGMFWKGDSRQCLSPINGFRAIDSNTALGIFQARIHDDFSVPLTRDQIFYRLGRPVLR